MKYSDYKHKILQHYPDTNPIAQNELEATAINSLLNFLNYCFNEKNSFLVPSFNKKNLKYVHEFYNQIKTNILSKDLSVRIFDNISIQNLKLLKFIIFNIQLNYLELSNKISPIISNSDLSILIGLVNHELLEKNPQ